MMCDKEIVALFWARSEQAIQMLDEAYGASCTRLAKNILQSDADTEECVNDAYLALWNQIPPARPNPLAAYVLRVVRNLALKRYHHERAHKRLSRYDVALDELSDCIGTDTLEQTVSARELTRLLEAFLDTLERDSRVLFVRRYWYADSIADLAERFHISANLVSVRLSRVRGRLRNYLMKEGIEL